MHSLLTSAAVVGANSLISRLLGFVRDLLIARLFGADQATDAFFVAFRIPNLVRRLFAEGAFAMALVPVLNAYRQGGDAAALRRFVDALAGTLAAILVLLTGIGLIAAPLWVMLFAPGFALDAGQRELTATLLRFTLPYILFVSLTALAGAILNTYGRFAVPAFTPALLNLALIASSLWVAPHCDEPMLALAGGVFCGGLVQMAFQLPFLRQLGLLPRPRFGLAEPGVQQVVRAIGPTVLGVSVAQISLLIDTLLASFLVGGSISWLYYAERLMEFPLGILGVALSTVILPRLAQGHAAADREDFIATLDWALRWVLLLGLPAAVGLWVLAEPLMATLFYSDHFSARDARMAAIALMGYAVGILGIMGVKILATAYYARNDTRTPLRIALLALACGLVCDLALLGPCGHAGLALGTALAATLNAALLWRGLIVRNLWHPHAGWTGWLAKTGTASLLMGLLLLAGMGDPHDWYARDQLDRGLSLAGWVSSGAALYLGMLLVFGVRPRHLGVGTRTLTRRRPQA